jgi:hypothetical protein
MLKSNELRGGEVMETSKIKEVAVEKISKLSQEEVSKLLIFMAGLDAGYKIACRGYPPGQTPMPPEKQGNKEK